MRSREAKTMHAEGSGRRGRGAVAIGITLLLAGCGGGGAPGSGNAPPGGMPAPAGDAPGSGGTSSPPVLVTDLGVAPPDAATPAPANRPTLPGIVLWLDAGQGLTVTQGKVSAWADGSSSRNDARQGNAQYRPVAATAANQLPAVRFSGKVDPKNGGGDGGPFLTITDTDSLHWGTGDWSIFVVGSYHNPLDGTHNGALGAFFGRYDVPEILFCGNWTLTETTEQSALHLGLGEGNAGLESTRKSLNDGVVRLYVGRKANDTLELRINGVVDSHVSGPDVKNANVSNNKKDVGIGSFDGNTPIRALAGDIVALVAVRGTITDAQLKEVETYLMTQYHVTK